MREILKRVTVILLGVILLTGIAISCHAASPPPVLIDWLTEKIMADTAYTQGERDLLISKLREKLGKYATEPLDDPNKLDGANVMMSVIMEGTFDRVKSGRIAVGAARAYYAARDSTYAEAVEGIALYALKSKVTSKTISTWAHGYTASVEYGVPGYLASDLVYQAYKQRWDTRTYNIFRWAQMEAASKGYDQDAFMAYMMEHYRHDGFLPAGMVAKTLQYFKQSRATHSKIEASGYKGSYLPSGASIALLKANKRKRTNDFDKAFEGFSKAPFAWNGRSDTGIDSAGLVYRVFLELGISVPDTLRGISKAGKLVRVKEIRKGDLVFFGATDGHISHIGIINNSERLTFLHVSPTKGVRQDSLRDRYFMERFVEARRI
jgi:hypothetical protein